MSEIDSSTDILLTLDMTYDSDKSIIETVKPQFPKVPKFSFDVDTNIHTTIEVANSPERDKLAVGLATLPDKAEEFYRKNGGTFTLMVAGESGLGKTTFINTLFDTDLVSKTESTAAITVQKFDVEEERFPLRFTAIDTPGFGQYINNRKAWEPLNEFIDEQFRLYLFQSEQPDRSKIVDTRVHCCLYFLSPSGTTLEALDVLTMKELSQRVNLIPVIAKSDTLNHDEMHCFKHLVRETLARYEIPICNLILDDDVILNIHSMVPFAVIGMDGNQRGRKYKWGVAEVENPDHCDFTKLRDLLMVNNLLDFVLSTEPTTKTIVASAYKRS